MISDTLLWEDDASVIAGQIVIIDLQGLGFGHIGQITPSILKYMSICILYYGFILFNNRAILRLLCAEN